MALGDSLAGRRSDTRALARRAASTGNNLATGWQHLMLNKVRDAAQALENFFAALAASRCLHPSFYRNHLNAIFAKSRCAARDRKQNLQLKIE